MQRKFYLIRAAAILIILGVGYLMLARHLYHVQITRHEELYGKAKSKYTTSRTERGQRGRIFDKAGNLLAGNVACYDVFAEPRYFNANRSHIIDILSSELNVSAPVLRDRFASTDKGKIVEVVVARQVNKEHVQAIEKHGFSGIRFRDIYQRYYPKGKLLSNVLGFLGKDGPRQVGVSGIEHLLDDELQPTSGTQIYERDRKGYQLHGHQKLEKVRDGRDVFLTVQEPIQQIVEDELLQMVEKHEPRAAYAVMANPRTGAIMALAQYPTFDPNNRKKMDPDHWRIRLLSEGFEPGSVMKCVAVAGAIDYGVVDLDTVYDCEEGYWVYCRRPLRDSGHAYGKLSVWEIIQKSSNIGAAKIALDMGETRLFQTLYRFGFGRSTGLGFPNEAPGIFRPLRKWDGLSITRFPIGQGILVTPLQLVQSYCALANNGVMMQLYVVDRIVTPETGLVENCHPKIKHRTIRPETAGKIVSAMKLVTQEGGTALQAAVPGYEVAGKTGTAQKVVDGQYSRRKFISNFIGFVPAEAPAFVLLVVADEPTRNGYYGGTVAAPVFSRIAEKTLRYLQVAPAVEHASAAVPPGMDSYVAGETVSDLR